jgi:CheY-like chemotaxis protein
VLDILLNQEDGLKIAREIKDDPKTSHIPIILISALPNVDKLAKDVEADAYLAKPFDVQDLNEAVEKILKKPALA